MDKYTNNEKIKLIKKYFKKDYTFLELSLKNYESYNIYIILTFNKKGTIIYKGGNATYIK